MGGWLASGRRRDACVVCYGTDGLRAQEIKARLAERYDRRIDPSTFYGSLDELVDAGYLSKRTEGLHDVYELTEAGRAAVEAQYEWMGEVIEDDEAIEDGESIRDDEAIEGDE